MSQHVIIREISAGNVAPGDWATHRHRDLDPRPVAAVDGTSIRLAIGDVVTDPVPVSNYSLQREVEYDVPTEHVTVERTTDLEHFVGTVDGQRFRYMMANRETAERERDRALRALQAWTAILDADLPRR